MLRLRKMRELGITVRSVRAILKSKQAVDLREPTELLALDVLDELVKGHPEGWDDIDWDAVLAFIMRLIELLLPFIL